MTPMSTFISQCVLAVLIDASEAAEGFGPCSNIPNAA